MQNVTTPVLISDSREKSKSTLKIQLYPKILRTLILSNADKSSSALESQFEEIVSTGKTGGDFEDQLMSFFKYPNATYLSSVLFNQLQINLDRSITIVNSKKTEANLHD